MFSKFKALRQKNIAIELFNCNLRLGFHGLSNIVTRPTFFMRTKASVKAFIQLLQWVLS